jgi:hypothetical protein
MENWPVSKCMYAVRTFVGNTSVVEVQWRFRHEFGVGRHGRVP